MVVRAESTRAGAAPLGSGALGGYNGGIAGDRERSMTIPTPQPHLDAKETPALDLARRRLGSLQCARR